MHLPVRLRRSQAYSGGCPKPGGSTLYPTPPVHFELALHVDAGEASAIAAAAEWGCGVLMDDKAGRRMAKNFCVASIGTVGVLVLAGQKKLFPSIKPLLDQLTASGYFLGDKLIASARASVGE